MIPIPAKSEVMWCIHCDLIGLFTPIKQENRYVKKNKHKLYVHSQNLLIVGMRNVYFSNLLLFIQISWYKGYLFKGVLSIYISHIPSFLQIAQFVLSYFYVSQHVRQLLNHLQFHMVHEQLQKQFYIYHQF